MRSSVLFSSASGASGTSGWSGYSGPVGGSGNSGFSGFSGTSGASGYSGLSGYSSLSGTSGTSGHSGESGYSGYSGSSGSSGTSGYSGFSGDSGLSGTSGYSGLSGYSSLSGTSGYSGLSGNSGTSGYSGYSGEGLSGTSGKSGYSGYSGYSGSSGYSGLSGTSAYSGISGRSGYSGINGLGQSNIIDNSNFAICQRITPAVVTDDTYLIDRWNVLTETAGVSGTKGFGVLAPGSWTGYLKQYQASAQRCMFEQIIPFEKSYAMQNQNHQLSFWTYQDTGGAINVRYALLWWSGTADVVTSDVVNNWTSGTYTTGNFFNSTTLAVIKTANASIGNATWTQVTASISAAEMGALSASNANVVLCLWYEPQLAQNKTVYFAAVDLYQGDAARAYVGPDPSTEMVKCQRYFYRFTPTVLAEQSAMGYVNHANYMWFDFKLPVQMRATPTPSTRGSAVDWYIFSGSNTYYAMSADLTLTGKVGHIYGYASTASSLTAGWAGMLSAGSGYSGWLQAAAEL